MDAVKEGSVFVPQDNIYPHDGWIDRSMRNRQAGHKSGVVWLTGLSGAGKSTLASNVEQQLFEKNYLVTILDGDSIRDGLNADLDFSPESRKENLRRSGEVAAMLANRGFIVLASFVSPFNEGRRIVQDIVGDAFHLVHVHAEINDCINRDPKGLYKKAMTGEIKNFTGIGQSYEPPEDPDLIVNTSSTDVTTASEYLAQFIERNFRL
jgi:bifunctional enzyme CysN/CysC